MDSHYKNPYTPLSTEDGNTSSDALPIQAQKDHAHANKGILALTTSLFLLCAGLGAALYYQINSACGVSYVSESSHIKVPHRAVIFLPHDEYTHQLPDEPGSVWDKLIPPGRGFVAAKQTKSGALAFEEYSSVSLGADSSKEYYCISAFHQMHCLAIIYNAIFSKNHSDHHHRDDHSDHTKHCIDYLRQSIMCASDATLESSGVLEGDGSTIRAVDGWNNTHQCRDWDSLYDFASRHRMLDSDGIV
ncbi:hypothetical protein BDV38DRAFT_282605 [Aspergillus pseudotamarii]|uniref:Tat pathway signal sequence n=1 Tax=Aspergillus pseudotamarii TaxID=132259 RepID=A0A5N6SVS8_ASPPS|nr:uncharacterized protein BDV38DRAFT_282605 [Aspergillus pseudotamarii]KAE8137997.1 hypothetical protein BDV38DRAFT_282605 [Aspergillus pseudotamarii]